MKQGVSRALRQAWAHLPSQTRWGLGRRLIARANAERDAQNYRAAIPLYEEALRLVPQQPRFLMQYGHMHKEAGDYASAEHYYGLAAGILADDPDVAIQLGHFYKVAGRHDEARASYLRAVALRPGWVEAEKEAAALAGGPSLSRVDGAAAVAAPLPQLLPRPAPAPGAMREGFFVRRLGVARVRREGGFHRVLRGVEAIHGFLVSSADIDRLTIKIDGEIIRNETLLDSVRLAGGQTKYVFNIWHDFSHSDPGVKFVELRAARRGSSDLVHGALLEIAAPATEQAFERSDAIVDPPPSGETNLEAWVNARPSMVRPARRGLLDGKPRAVLVQRADQLGDLVCSIPALERLRALYPETRLVALVTPANADLAYTLPMLDDVVVAEFHEEADGRKVMPAPAQKQLQRTLAQFDFDIAIDLGETAESRPLLLLSGAPILYGFKDREFPWLTAGFELNTHDPANHGAMAATAHKLVAMIDAIGELIDPPLHFLRRQDLDGGRLARFGIAPGERYAVLHTGARLAYSRWPGFAELAGLLLDRTDVRIIVMGDEPLADLPRSERITMVTDRLPFDDFDCLLSFAALFVGNDSGPKHLASLRGVPVVSLHMARLNWNEWGQEASGLIVSRRVPCAGCGIAQDAEDCGKDFACIRWIEPEEVFQAGVRLLEAPLQSSAG